jgi:hypothetical protein
MKIANITRRLGSRGTFNVEADATIEAQKIALPSLNPGSTGMGLHLANTIIRILGKLEAGELPVRVSELQIKSPIPAEMTGVIAGGGGPGSFIYMDIEMKEAPATATWKASLPSYEGVGEKLKKFNFKPSGELRLLIVDDQRTMQNLVLMLFQKICLEFPSMKVLASTAISGEEAVRLCESNSFHIVVYL